MVLTLASVLMIVSADTFTVTVQRVSVLPLGQLLPAAVEVTVLDNTWSPGSGLRTVTEYLIVAVAPTARSPVQARFGLLNETEPAVALASPL